MSIPDKFHRDLQKLIQKENPQTLEEMQKLMDSLMGKPLPETPDEDLTPEDKALDLVDEAWSVSAAKGKELAQKALDSWPDCIPAYEYLAAKTKSAKERKAYYQKGVDIGQRLFGGDFLQNNRGYFWGITETRPYMRCLDGLARNEAETGQLSKAIVIWEDMLSLNPHDNQGVRYNLLPALLRQHDLTSYHRYRKTYPEDSTMMVFNDALVSFMENGDSEESRAQLKASRSHNPYVVPLLLEKAPPSFSPDSYILNSPEEAFCYANDTWQVWQAAPGAIDWLKKQQPDLPGTGSNPMAPALDELSDESLRILTIDPFSPVSPLQLRPGLRDENVAHLPFLKLAQQLLAMVNENQPLKLTTKGNLPRKQVQQLYGLGIFKDKYIDDGTSKLLGEEDFLQLHMAHLLCKMSKLLSNRSGKAALTKKGKEMLESPAMLYVELLKTFTQGFNWAYVERWGYGVDWVGQNGWALVLYKVIHQGDFEKSDGSYALHYMTMFPEAIDDYPTSEIGTPLDKLKSDFRWRFVYRFCLTFGLVEIVRETKGKYDITDELFIKRSALADQVFQLVSFS